jgi:HEPN domain-containing protein
LADRSNDWLEQALRDLEQAGESMRSGRHEWACFAAHQAAGKALKALNLALGHQVWGHTLSRLWSALPAQTWTPEPPVDLQDRLRLLDGFYIPTCRVSRPFSMPMPSSAGSVLRWPSSEQVIAQATAWATAQRQRNPDLLAVGVFGSYGRGNAGVGSDLDLVLILADCALPIWERLRRWDTGSLPLACDLLVYSLKEWQTLPQWNPRLADALVHDTRWLVGEPPQLTSSPAIPRR